MPAAPGQISSTAMVTALKAAAEPTRLRILALLATSALSVKDLTRILGQSQPRLSRHLKLLTEAGLVERAPEGSWVYFHLADGPSGLAREMLVPYRRRRPDLRPRPPARADTVQEERQAAAQAYFAAHAAEWDRIRALHVAENEVEAAMRDALAPGRSTCWSISAPAPAACSNSSPTATPRARLRPQPRHARLRARQARRGRPRPRPGPPGRHLRPAAGRRRRRSRGDAPGAALPRRSAARDRARPRACWSPAARC